MANNVTTASAQAISKKDTTNYPLIVNMKMQIYKYPNTSTTVR